MRPRHRVGIVGVHLTLAALVLTSAAAPAVSRNTVAGPESTIGVDTSLDPGTAASGQQVLVKSDDPPAGAVPRKSAIQELRAATLVLQSDGTVGSVTALPGQRLASNADTFVQRYAAAFGLNKAHTIVGTSTKSVGSEKTLRYQQHSAGLPVLGGEVVVLATADGSVRSAITQTTSLKPIGDAKLSAEAARGIALKAAQEKYAFAPGEVTKTEATLWLLDPSLIGLPGQAQLRPTYWVMLAEEDGHDLASVLVDAIDGTVQLIASEHRAAKDRIVCDLANAQVNLSTRIAYACNDYSPLGQQSSTRSEGEADGGVSDVNAAYQHLGVAYDYFKNNFGRDSFDGRGAQIRATVRACDPRYACPYQNAFYGGGQFVFGQGWAVDDVSAHEFTHAVTDYASSLYYWQQSGAINESLSDIFGELIDLSTPGDGTDDTTKRWLAAEARPGGAIRNLANPPAFNHPDQLYGQVYWDFDYDGSDNGGVHTNSGVGNKAAYLIADGGSFGGQTVTGIGLAKSGQLWYRVMHMLPSGANYQELGLTLSAVCRSLIGHLGFTAADCNSGVDRAVAATTMLGHGSGMDPGQPRVPACPGSTFFWPGPVVPESGEPSVDLFFDDMERPTTKWTTNNGRYWQQLPNSDISYSYAAGGRGSINGWTTSGESAHGTYIEMSEAVQLPVGKAPFVHLAHSLDAGDGGYGRTIAIYIQANGGAWTPLTAPYQGTQTSNGQFVYQSRGYGKTKIDLSGFAGQAVKIRFQIHNPQNFFLDWYFDDFRIGYCDNLTGAPREGYGYHTPEGISLNWAAPKFVSRMPGGEDMGYQWELAYSPAIPGAPTMVSQNLTSYLLSNTDPGTRYTVTIVARAADGRLGQPIDVIISPGAPVVCPSTNPSPFLLSHFGRRPSPGLPAGTCFRTPIPRRGL